METRDCIWIRCGRVGVPALEFRDFMRGSVLCCYDLGRRLDCILGFGGLYNVIMAWDWSWTLDFAFIHY